MNVTQYLFISEGSVVAFVGCGGKTSAIEALIGEIQLRKIPILHTTTTKIFPPSGKERHILLCEELNQIIRQVEDTPQETITIGTRIENEKLVGIPVTWVDVLHERFPRHCILVEADGCKGKSIKLYEDHEPCVPLCTDKTIIMVGFDAFQEEDSEKVIHRHQSFMRTFENKCEQMPEERIYALFDQKGLIEGLKANTEKYLFLNKIEDRDLEKARVMGEKIMALGAGKLAGVIVGNTKSPSIVWEVIR